MWVKQFPIEGGRYLVFLFETDQFEGELADSDEGKMHWVRVSELANVNVVNDRIVVCIRILKNKQN